MANEDDLNGVKTAFIIYNTYQALVGQEIGMEKAFDLHKKMCETMGAMQGKMIKEQSGIKDFDAKVAHSLTKSIPEVLGITTEVIVESPSTVRFKLGKCSVYKANQMSGLDEKTREKMCRDGSLKLMDTFVKELNLNLTCQLSKYRSSADDCCIEEIVSK